MNTTELCKQLLNKIRLLSAQLPCGVTLRFMEVCGTHTVSIFRAGLRQLLPENIQLVSGPGCPVCVTDDSYMDKAIAYALQPDTVIATFGDMLKVPGSNSSLAEAKAKGADIRIVYSPMDTLAIAKANPGKKVIFLAVGFETTAPTAAATVLAAQAQGIDNLYMLSAHKLVPPALRMLLADPEVHVDGFILPGHVCVVTGTEIFEFLPRDYNMPSVVAGFETVELLRAIYRLLKQKISSETCLQNEYGTVVRSEGNPQALAIMHQVYQETTVNWRGLGAIEHSGLKMRAEFDQYDIEVSFPIYSSISAMNGENRSRVSPCRCGDVLRGVITPPQCPLFAKICTPEHSVGPCMVSVEGSCAAWYKYGGGKFVYGK